MFVVFGPEKSDGTYIGNKILSKIPQKEIKEIIRWNQGSRSCVFMGGEPVSDLLWSPKGWFLGYAYWDSLPDGCEIGTKNLLETSFELWKKEGIDFLKRLNGSFNLFLYDAASGKSLLSTDRFGTHPLWMAELDRGGFAFSPDYNQLIPFVKTEVDPSGMWSFVTRWRPVGNHTLLKSIKGVRQATSILFDKHGNPEATEWFSQVFHPQQNCHLNDWADEFNKCLLKTTQEHLSGVNSIGVLLSGGIDSRLIASYCPKGTHCFTLADFENYELKTAKKIAQICGHEHHKIIRDVNWYADALVPASKQCAGLWRWNDAHFWKLRNLLGAWQEINCVVLGNWFDTFFKGAATPIELWEKTPNLYSEEKAISFCLDVDDVIRGFIGQVKEVMLPHVFKECHQAHRKALSDELRMTIPNASCLIDAWDMTQFGSVYRSSAFPNIHCLRDFKPVRNVIFDNAFYDLYLSVPARIRQHGEIVRRALWRRNKSLGVLTDSNSWLPAALPTNFHSAALQARGVIARTRNYLYRKIRYNEHRSCSAWTRIAPLWVNNPTMKNTMNQILKNPNSVLQEYFVIDSLQRVWKEHQEGAKDYSEILNAIAGLGLLEL